MLLKTNIDDMLALKIEYAKLNEKLDQTDSKPIEPRYFAHH